MEESRSGLLDSLSPGDFIMIIGSEIGERVRSSFSGVTLEHEGVYDFLNGKPLKILAINLPFFLVQDIGEVIRLDTRKADFLRCDPKYAEMYLKHYAKKNDGKLSGNSIMAIWADDPKP